MYEVTHSSPDRLIETIRRWRVDVRLVRSDTNALPLNPLLAQLPLADPALIREVDFRDTYEGLVIHGGSPHCAPGRSLILIRDTATSYTLIHEFVQSQLRPECAGEPYHSLEVRFGAAFRRLQIYERRLLDDPYRLLDPRWRRDILAAQTDVAQTLYDRIRLGQSQEAIVEKLLSAYIDERNPYFDATRRAQGLRYGEVMIDNAVDLFDAVTNSLAFVEETVRTLLTSVLKGEIAPDRNIDLTDADLALVEERAQVIRAHLAPVQGELQVLKQFYAG